jgi:thioesterase domain-containing protein/acyl-CoA synthetase (AMP-forming)/AMP-acid ligase II
MGADFADVPIFGHLRNIAERHPDKLAISDGDHHLTYSELVGAVATLSGRIAADVPEGQAVGILLANSVWNPVALLASMTVGRLAVPLNARDPASRISGIATAARLSAIIGFGAAPDIGLVRSVQWIDVAPEVVPSDQGTFAPPLSGSVDAPAIVLYTSDSTENPKGIANSQRNLLHRVQQYVDACHAGSGDVFLPLIGPATIAGCVEMLAALLSGATLHLLEVEAVGLSAVRHCMQAAGVTIGYLEPTLLRALMADDSADAFRSLRVARVGGKNVSWADIALLRKAVSDDCLIQIAHSPAETTGSQWFVPRDWPEQDAFAPVGWLLPGITFVIVDEEGRPARLGESGELLIRSPYVLLGHWENGTVVKAETDPDDPNLRIFATGDLVRLDDRGLLHIIGRKREDDVVKKILSARADDRLTHTREASLPILFLLPGSLGYGPSLTALTASMRKVTRIAPIRYPDLGMILGGQNSVADMAAAAVEQISRVQPLGHVRLLGHSLGGAVAFEVAARLLAAGRSVKFMGVLDTSLMGERSSYWETVTRTVHRIRTNRVTASRMACRGLAKATVAIGCEARLARIIDRYTKRQFNATCFRLRQELQEVLRAQAYFRWLAEPKPVLPIAAILFRCNRKRMPQALGWDRAFIRVDVIPSAGSHADLVMQPHLATNGPLIERAVLQTYSPADSLKRDAGLRRDCTNNSQPNQTSVQ